MRDETEVRLRRIHREGQDKVAMVRGVPYQDVPVGMRMRNLWSGKAAFMGCHYRRRGYTIKVSCVAFAEAVIQELSAERERALLDKWLRGELWRPPIIKVGLRGEPEALSIIGMEECDMVTFLAGRQTFCTVQVLEEGDPPASLERMEELRGLFTKNFFPLLEIKVVM